MRQSDTSDKLDLIAATVHELKTPLTLINGMSSMLDSQLHGDLNDRQREQVRHIQQATQRLGALVESLLHVENLPYARNRQPVQLQYELKAVAEELAEYASERDVGIVYKMHKTPPVLAEPSSVYHVLSHSVMTAIKHSPSGSTVNIGVRRRSEEVALYIDSNGAPILPKEVSKIEKNLGVHRQPIKSQGNSAGLSLFIIKSIVEFYEGRVSVSSQNDKGRLTISLPISNQLSLFL